MKMRTKTIAGVAIIAVLTVGAAMTSMAEVKGVGQWCEGLPDGSKSALTNLENGNAQTNWWFIESPDGATVDTKNSAANTWLWISGKCYYFDADGWMIKAKDGNAGTITDHTGATYHVDANGAWTDENGVVMTNTENAEEWTHVEYLVSGGSSSANTETEVKKESEATNTVDKMKGNGSESVPEGEYEAKGKGKVNSKGEKPDDADYSNNAYQLGTKSGNNITNAWANYSIDFNGWQVATPEGNTDTIAIDDANIISIWFDNLNSRSYDSFIESRVDGVEDGTETLGGITYTRYKKTTANPAGNITNYNYVRQIGNAVMIIETTGNPSTINSVLSTMKTVN